MKRRDSPDIPPLKTLLHVLSQPRGVIFVCYPAGSSPLYTHHDIQMMWEQIGKEKKPNKAANTAAPAAAAAGPQFACKKKKNTNAEKRVSKCLRAHARACQHMWLVERACVRRARLCTCLCR